ncbi:MAG: hypothetical protein C5S38_02780 [Candidatus Methanophagaceae archaeon]|nr:MAG: hypothetical protein C5S38_02780 [Methanophagales archaeon]
MSEQRKLVRNNNLVEKLVIVDGIGRSGKSLMGVTLASMLNVEKERIDAMLDYIPRLYAMNKLSRDAAVTMLRIEVDNRLYDTMISRAVNFRPSDYTGIFKYPNPLRYIERLFLEEEGAPVVERVRKEKPIFQNMTHDGLSYAKIFFEAFGDKLFFIEMLRNPIDIVYDWHIRDFGTRIGKDPREFQFTFEWKGEMVPIMAHGWEDEYLTISPVERIIRMIDTMYRKNIKTYNELTREQKERIFFVVFDKFVEYALINFSG